MHYVHESPVYLVRLESGLIVQHTKAEYERLVKNVVCPDCGESITAHRADCDTQRPCQETCG